MRIPGVCNNNPETVVFCHLNEHWAGKGMGTKAHDIGFFGCHSCHSAYDQNKIGDDKYFYLLRAVVKTWLKLIELGVVRA